MRRGGEEQETVPRHGGCDITGQGSAVDWFEFYNMMQPLVASLDVLINISMKLCKRWLTYAAFAFALKLVILPPKKLVLHADN